MEREGLTGSRIRERRIMAGLKQAELARRIGISASYLNLIEHNRRRIGGKLLLGIAQTLDVEPQMLTDGAEAALIGSLREAALDAGLSEAEADRADEFAGRFPAWADVVADSRRRIGALERTVETLTDRMAHDPHLAASMHELLTTAAAIRSTAAILAETKTLEPEWRERFHANIHEDSRRLSDSAEALVGYLDMGEDDSEAIASPQEEVEAFFDARGYHFAELEAQGADHETVDDILADAAALKSVAALHIARNVLMQVAEDARHLSLSVLRNALGGAAPDPIALARALDCPVPLVLRRLAALPELAAGLVVCDRSGTVVFRKAVDGFSVPRFGACCPLWPLFSVLGQPGLVVHEAVQQLGRSPVPFDAYATSHVPGPARYNTPPPTQATMLILPRLAGERTAELNDIGVTCRICPRAVCAARREPSILEGGF